MTREGAQRTIDQATELAADKEAWQKIAAEARKREDLARRRGRDPNGRHTQPALPGTEP